ncbi:hypothetical protein QEV56_04470 [Trueperella pyogenes]|uniref:hypothetical protein n=1 Tax=Trueperella pyogenes TaxID=1661 RepID=UPI0032444B38
MALTEQQKQAATRIRQQGGTVKQAADILMVSTQELKNYLHRAGITQTQADADGLWCAWCGQRIDASKFNTRKRFCSDSHRLKWWSANRFAITPKSRKETVCPNCGTTFSTWHSSGKKYCNHACYIQHRYGTRGGKP